MKKGVPVVLDVEEIEAFLDRVKAHALENEDYDLIVGITEGYARVTQAISEKEISISRLRSILFGASTDGNALQDWWYWSSTTFLYSPDHAWVVGYMGGTHTYKDGWGHKTSPDYRAIAVRGGL